MAPAAAHQRITLRGFEPGAFAEVIAGGRFEHTLLGPAPVSADLEHAHAPGVVADRGSYTFATHVRGSFDPSMLCFGTVRTHVGNAVINGRPIGPGDLQIYAEDAPLDYTAGPMTDWLGLQLPRGDLEDACEQAGLTAPLPARGDRNLTLAQPDAAGLARCIDSLFADARAGDDLASARRAITQLLVESIARSASASARAEPSGTPQAPRLIRRALAEMRADLSAPYDSAFLCDRVNTSERSLQLAFRRTLGISPSRCNELLRLNAAYNAMLNASPSAESVTTIAMRFGFTHMGRFAKRYADTFGRLPSAVLKGPPRGPR
ncbi:MAG: helix-turn-helix transcriptional regulator [Planctomycetota bacterium]